MMRTKYIYIISYILILLTVFSCKRHWLGDFHPAIEIRELRNETDYIVRILVFDSAKTKEDILIFPGRSDSAIDNNCIWALRGGVNCYGNVIWNKWADSIYLYFDDKRYIRYCYDFVSEDLNCDNIPSNKNIMIFGTGYEFSTKMPRIIEDPVIDHYLYRITEEDYELAQDL